MPNILAKSIDLLGTNKDAKWETQIMQHYDPESYRHLKILVFVLALLSLFFLSGLSSAYGLTPEEKAELQVIRQLLIKSEQKNIEAIDKLKLSELELERQREVIRSLQSTLAEQEQTLQNLEVLHEKQLKELTNYWKRREVKTGAICGASGIGVGALAVIFIFLIF